MSMSETAKAAKREYQRQWREQNREHYNQYQREYRKKNQEVHRNSQNTYWERKAQEMGLTDQ